MCNGGSISVCWFICLFVLKMTETLVYLNAYKNSLLYIESLHMSGMAHFKNNRICHVTGPLSLETWSDRFHHDLYCYNSIKIISSDRYMKSSRMLCVL